MAANVVELNSSNWKQEVLESSVPVVVDFWAVWCGPCRMIAPAIEQLAAEYAGKIKVGKVNVDDSQELAAEYRVTNIPQVFIFKNGTAVERLVGAHQKNAYQAMIDRALQ